ncbi:MAG: lyase family protein [Candidatus Parcubacteria bacterium]|nr:lyase family protein [Candidatus Parcubacteria bacterium]
MIERYANKQITAIWSDKSKLEKWQAVELAVIMAREKMGIFPAGTHQRIAAALESHPFDADAVAYWKAKDKEINHDLNAFLDERLRHIPAELHQYWHKGLTSYDTEEPAMALLLKESLQQIELPYRTTINLLLELAKKYRYTPMLGRTHGQEAKLQSFGKRCLTWLKGLQCSYELLIQAAIFANQSKLSGAIGNHQGLTMAEEAKALEILELKPFIGATQIMPRIIYVPIANALELMVASLTQIAEDIRLGSRSGNPIMQEPFGKKQKGSSAMPHKKNSITTEQQIGMLTAARNFAQMLRERVITWEERAIEQSCVERIAWPDLFAVVMQSFKNMNKVLEGLQVYPDNMMQEIVNSRGCYASEDAKDWLKERIAPFGLTHEDAYRIVQVASFIAHQIPVYRRKIRDAKIISYEQADGILRNTDTLLISVDDIIIITEIIEMANLRPVEELDIEQATVDAWNKVISDIFDQPENQQSWNRLFTIAYQLRGEAAIFKAFGIE